MHYHVVRVDYDTHTGDEAEPVHIGIAEDFADRNRLIDEDAKQFRLPSAKRHILHDYSSKFCLQDHS